MNQDQLYIFNYIKQKLSVSMMDGASISDYQVQRLFDSYYDKTSTIDKMISKIDSDLSKLHKGDISNELIGLKFNNIGINLSLQQVDLLNIVGAKNIEELNKVCKTIKNTSIKLSKFSFNVNRMSAIEFEEVQKKCFKLYKDSLLEIKYSHTDKGITDMLNNRIDYIMDRGRFSSIEHSELMEVVRFSKNLDEIPILLNKKFGKDKTSEILNLLKSYDPVESIGLLDTTFEEFKNLYYQLHLFNTVTFNNEFCYNRVCNADGTFHYDRLLKCFEFAKKHNLKVIVNGLICYNYYPTSLYNASSAIVYDKLFKYISDITSFIAKYNKENNIISKVVIMEDLLENDEPFRYRRLCSSVQEKGWTDKLTLTQIIDICNQARANLSGIPFIYAESNLVNKTKREALYKLLESIKLSRKKIFDSIGLKLSVSSNITIEEIEEMLQDIQTLGFNIDITGFEMHIKEEYINTHTPEEIYSFKMIKYAEMCKIFNKYISVIDSFSIHSISNKMDYYRFNKNNLDNYYGGYFAENIVLVSKLNLNSNISSSNYLINIDNSKYSYKDYADRALANGIKKIGFLKRIANNKYQELDGILKYEELNNYVKDLKLAKLTYADLRMYSGIISDYEILNTDYLVECKSKCDYMVLDAQINEVSINTPINYATKVCNALETGIYDLVLYPDKFMKYRDKFSASDYNTYISNCTKASEMICSCAKRNNIPLCLDLNYNLRNQVLNDKEWPLNHPLFWNMAKEKNNLVVFSNSVSDPTTLDNTNDNIEKVKAKLDISALNIAGSKYDLVASRKTNKLLNKKFQETNSKYRSFEYYYIKDIIGNSSNILDDLGKKREAVKGTKQEEIVVNAITYYETKNKDNLNNILKLIERKYNNREISKMHRTGYTYTIGVLAIVAITALVTCVIIILASK